MPIETCRTRDSGYMGERARGASLGRANRTGAARAAALRSDIALHERIRARWAQEDSRYAFAPTFGDSDYQELDRRLDRMRAELSAIETAGARPPKFHLRRVRLDSGGYDQGGAYWGHGGALYEAFTADGREFLTLRVMPDDRRAAFVRRGGAPVDAPGYAEFRKGWPNWHKVADREAARDIVRESYPDAKFYR